MKELLQRVEGRSFPCSVSPLSSVTGKSPRSRGWLIVCSPHRRKVAS